MNRSILSATLVSCVVTLTAAVATAQPLDPNTAPRAYAGTPRSVVIGERVTLDASQSSDLDGDRLNFQWTLRAPRGSAARLSDPHALRPSFVVDLLGEYTAELVVNDNQQDSIADVVTISTGNVAPVAVASADGQLLPGEPVVLDGSASWDFNGDALRHRWRLIDAPVASRAAVLSARTVRAAFIADVAGEYVFELTVSDGVRTSKPSTLIVNTGTSVLRADAGPDRNVLAGGRLRLNGQPTSGDLAYSWSVLHAPHAAAAMISDSNSAQPWVRVDVPGTYLVQLLIDDKSGQRAVDTLVIDAVAVPAGQPRPTRGPDIDGDGIADQDDNCVEDFNPSQLDTNGDGFGNLCDPDLDNDGVITNFGDLQILKAAFFSQPGNAQWNPDADFNGDNIVNFADLQIMKNFFFGPPGPIAIRFINPAGGSWHDPANWDLGVIPTIVHTAIIDLAAGMVVEFSMTDTQVAGLRTTSELELTGGTLTVAGNAGLNGELRLAGGTLRDANIIAGNTPIVVPSSTSGTLDGVTLGAELTISNNATLFVQNDLTLSGGAAVTLASDGNFVAMAFQGAGGVSSTLGGTGEVVFGGTTASDAVNIVQAFDSTHGLVVGAGVTIRTGTTGGVVRHRFGNGPVAVHGPVISDLAAHTVTLAGAPLTVSGAVQGSNGGNLTVTPSGVGSVFSGAATMSGGGKLSFNAAAATVWDIDAAASITVSGGELELFGGWTNASGAISVTDGLLDIGNTSTGEWDNNGTITLSNTTTELGGRYTVADIGTLVTTDAVIINGTLDNTGSSFDAGSDLAGTVQLGSGGEIEGGSVLTTALVQLSGTSFTLDGVTLGAELTISNNATLFVQNDLTLSGGAAVTLASDGNFVAMAFQGAGGVSSTLGGTGEVVFGGTTASDAVNIVQAFDSTHGLVVGAGVTIRTGTTGGVVRHRFGNGPVAVHGPVISDLAAHTVTLAGAPLTVSGAVQGSNGGNLTVTPSGVGSVFSGAATMSGGGKLSFNAAAATVWDIDAAASITVSGGELELFGGWTNASGAISVTDGLLDIGNTSTGEWDNNGTITLSNTTTELGGRYTVADIGTLVTTDAVIINGTLDNTGSSFDAGSDLAGTVQLGSGGEIEGGSVLTTALVQLSGTSFTLDGVTLGAELTISNNATLFVQNDLTLSGGAAVTLASDGNFVAMAFQGAGGVSSTLGGTGEVVFGGTTASDAVNIVQAFDSTHGLVVGAGVTIRTGTTGGVVRHRFGNGPVAVHGPVISDLAAHTVTLAGAPLTVSGAVQGSNGGNLTVTPSGVGSVFSGAATMSGGGKLSFNAAAATVWDIDAAASITVSGGELELFGGWTNASGAISVTDGLLDIGNTSTGEWDNNGTITLSNTTTELGGRYTVADIGTLVTTDAVIINGTLDNTGSSFDAGSDLAGTVQLGSGGEIEGGSVLTTALVQLSGTSFTLDGVTLGAELTISNNATLFVQNDLTLSGGAAVTLASDGNFVAMAFQGAGGVSSTLGGTGEVVFGGTTASDAVNIVQAFDSTHGLVVGAGVTIRTGTTGGVVRHRFGNGPVAVHGPVISDLAAHTVTLAGAPLTVSGAVQGSNGGNLTVTPSGVGSVFSGAATMSGGGKLSFNAAAATVWDIDAAASITVSGGELELFGGWTNASGAISVTDGLLDIGNTSTGEWDNNGTITLSNTTTELGGRYTVADIGTLVTTDAVIINGTLDNTGSSFDAGSDLAGTVQLGSGGEIEGGSVLTTALVQLSGTSFTLDGVTLGAELTISNNATLFVQNDLTLSGGAAVTLASDGNFVAMAFQGAGGVSSTLGGTGEVVFGGTTASDAVNIVQAFDSTHGLIVGAGVTIRTGTTGGVVRHRFGNGPVAVHGPVISDLAAHTVTLAGAPLNIEGSVQAGAGSVVNLSTDYTLASTASFDVDVGGTATTEFGRFTAAGRTANLDGTLNIALVNGFSPALDDTFEIMTFAARNGTFATENGTNIGGGLFFQVNYNATEVTLQVTN